MQQLFSVLVLICALFAATAHAQCTDWPDISNNICRFGDHGPVVVGGAAICEEVNDDPFATMSELCYNLMKDDGKSCSYALANYYCSARCPDCTGIGFKSPCESLCSNVQSDCPTMWANVNCRQANNCVADASCSDIDINKDRVDKLTGIGGGGGDGNAAPGKPGLGLWMVIAGLAMAMFAANVGISHTSNALLSGKDVRRT